jgi:predicted transcriptional regulator
MEVKLSPELQAKLDSMAAQQGRDSAALVHEAVERLIDYDDWFSVKWKKAWRWTTAATSDLETSQITFLKKHRKTPRA